MTTAPPNEDPFHLQRFVEAQASSYVAAQTELAAGRKRSHWMWFIFPQIQGLGSSFMAQRYAITDLEEAKAYLRHPVLGSRLRECTALVNAAVSQSVSEIFGYPDDLKFYSSITLFDRALRSDTAAPDTHENVFAQALDRHFAGRLDEATVARL